MSAWLGHCVHRKVLRSDLVGSPPLIFCLVREKMPLPVECPFPSPCPNRPYSPYHLTSYFHSPSPERHDPSQGQEKENHCGCVKMRLCPCGLDPQSHTISHATRCVPTLIAGSCWVGHGGAHAFFRYIPLSVETLRATSLRGGGIVGWVGFRQFIPIGAMYIL